MLVLFYKACYAYHSSNEQHLTTLQQLHARHNWHAHSDIALFIESGQSLLEYTSATEVI